jgi:hypothetical protein
LFGWAGNLSGLWWGVGVLAAALIASVATLVRPQQPAVPLRRAA